MASKTVIINGNKFKFLLSSNKAMKQINSCYIQLDFAVNKHFVGAKQSLVLTIISSKGIFIVQQFNFTDTQYIPFRTSSKLKWKWIALEFHPKR